MEVSEEPDPLMAPTPAFWDPVPAIQACLFAAMAAAIVVTLESGAGQVLPPPPTTKTVNPNVAPWYELSVLPRVGGVVARKIIHFRESASQSEGVMAQNPFSSAADLQNVHGIGPVTVQRIAPYLRFEDK